MFFTLSILILIITLRITKFWKINLIGTMLVNDCPTKVKKK